MINLMIFISNVIRCTYFKIKSYRGSYFTLGHSTASELAEITHVATSKVEVQ